MRYLLPCLIGAALGALAYSAPITGRIEIDPDTGAITGQLDEVTPPEPVEPPVPELSQGDGPAIHVTIPAIREPTVIHLRTKETDERVGVIPPGDTSLVVSQFGGLPLNAGWEYWARSTVEGAVSAEAVIQIHQAKPPEPPIGEGIPFPADRILRSGTTYTGKVEGGAITIPRDAVDITIVGAWFEDAQLTIGGGGNRNIRVAHTTFNGFRHRGGDNRAAIYQTTYTHGLTVEDCVFSNSNAWGILLYGAEGTVIQRNVFKALHQGAHILGPVDVIVRDNAFSHLERMGVEIQDIPGNRTMMVKRLTVEGNTVQDWARPFNDSFGLSIIPENTTNGVVVVRGNVIRSTRVGDWYPGREKRFGYGIEIGGQGSIVTGNVISAGKEQFVAGVATSSVPAAVITGNRFNGPTPAWGWFFRQPGRHGLGQYSEYGNVFDPAGK